MTFNILSFQRILTPFSTRWYLYLCKGTGYVVYKDYFIFGIRIASIQTNNPGG